MKKLYKEFFYVPKHAKVPDRVFKTRTILSFLTSFVCFVIFCSSTYAWFNANRNCDIQPIQTAEVLLTVQSGEWYATSDSENHVSYTCPLAENDNHSFTITNVGTASTGYCVINADGETFNTVQIGKGDSLTLTIQAAIGTEITFSTNWGSYHNGIAFYSVSDGKSYPIYGDGDYIVISTTSYEIYTVAEGATLELIAEHYGVSASDILLYNGIGELIVGEEIKIPNTEVTEPLVIEKEVSYVLYTVAEGVTIEMLAEYYGVPAEEILSFNNITELVVGMEIKIPNTEITEPFMLEEIPTTEDVATPPNATPSDAEETVPGTEKATEPTEPTNSTEPENSAPPETEESTEPTTPAETETVPVETTPVETSAPSETETSAAPSEEPTEEAADVPDAETTPAATSEPEITEAMNDPNETSAPVTSDEPTVTDETATTDTQ